MGSANELVTHDARINIAATLRLARAELARNVALSVRQGFTGKALASWRKMHFATALDLTKRAARRQLQELIDFEVELERQETGTDYRTPEERAEFEDRWGRVYPIHDIGNDEYSRNSRAMNAISERAQKRAYEAAFQRLRNGTGFSQRQQLAA